MAVVLLKVFEEANLSGELKLSGRKLKDFPKTAAKYNLSDTVIAGMLYSFICIFNFFFIFRDSWKHLFVSFFRVDVAAAVHFFKFNSHFFGSHAAVDQ